MKLFWLFVLAVAAGFAYWLRSWRRRQAERRRAAEERAASFVARAMGALPLTPASVTEDTPSLQQQRLLLEAAAKAGEAGEPALSIQLYARLLARYPETAFAAQVRASVAQLKTKLAKP